MDMNFDVNDAVPSVHLLTTSLLCQVHIRHIPRSHVNHVHHVWPKGLGGPEIAENKIITCPTGHYNIHQLLALWIKIDGDPGRKSRKIYSHGEQDYAELGYIFYKAGSVLTYHEI